MVPGMPSTSNPMDKQVKEAMFGLLKFRKQDRWTMDRLSKCALLRTLPTTNSKSWLNPIRTSIESCRLTLQKYRSSQPMPTALAVKINKRHQHLYEKALCDLNLGRELGVTVLLIKQASGAFQRIPSAETRISKGDWMYFGVPQDEDFTKAVEGLQTKLQPLQMYCTQSTQSEGAFRAMVKRDVVDRGVLVEFAVEFDCFRFPKHIGKRAEIGPNGLDLRKRFGINLVGIERFTGDEREVEWFPNGASVVEPGNLGLVMREPCVDGSSQPTLTEIDLAALMQKDTE